MIARIMRDLLLIERATFLIPFRYRRPTVSLSHPEQKKHKGGTRMNDIFVTLSSSRDAWLAESVNRDEFVLSTVYTGVNWG